MKLNVRHWMWTVGTFLAVNFALCVVYGLIVPSVYHAKQLLEMTLPGFHWISVPTFFLGLAESFIYGAYAGVLFAVINNLLVPAAESHDKGKSTRAAA
jgi:hypothetical protein